MPNAERPFPVLLIADAADLQAVLPGLNKYSDPPAESVTAALILVESVTLISATVAARTGLPASVARP